MELGRWCVGYRINGQFVMANNWFKATNAILAEHMTNRMVRAWNQCITLFMHYVPLQHSMCMMYEYVVAVSFLCHPGELCSFCTVFVICDRTKKKPSHLITFFWYKFFKIFATIKKNTGKRFNAFPVISLNSIILWDFFCCCSRLGVWHSWLLWAFMRECFFFLSFESIVLYIPRTTLLIL